MNTFHRLFLVTLTSLGLSLAPLLTFASSPTIFISEVAWAGSSLSASDEFLELYNPTTTSISLANWYLAGAATGGEALSFPEDAVVPPQSTYLIANYDIDAENSALEVTPDFVTASLALPNTKLSVALVDASGTVQDRVGDGTGSPSAGSVGVSMTRVAMNLNGATDEAWTSSTSSSGFKVASEHSGTPGFYETASTSTEPTIPAVSPTEPSIPAVSPEPTVEPLPEPEITPTQVYPNNRDIITVIYQGFVFELNLPEQPQTSSITSPSAVVLPTISTPVASTTDTVPQTVSAPTPSQLELVASAVASETEPLEETQPSIPIMSLQTLRISELYANTSGNDEEEEFIEIENFGSEAVNLNGWSLEDATEKRWTAEGNLILEAGEQVALSRTLTKITLNNTAESVKLNHPNGQVIDLISYASATKGLSYSRNGNAWSWQTPTPNEANTAPSVVNEESDSEDLVVPDIIMSTSGTSTSSSTETISSSEPDAIVITSANEDASSQSSTSSSSNTSSGFQSLSISAARTAPLGSSVRVEGTVVSTPGTYATQSFYLEDGAGIQVYLFTADFPALSVGDRIRVSGVTSQNRGEARVKLASANAIEFISSGNAIATGVRIESVNESTEAQLVTVQALVESARSNELTLVDGAGTLRVVARDRTGVSFSAITSGSTVRITGVVSESDGTYSLLPRAQSDIEIIELVSSDQPLVSGVTTSQQPPTGLYGSLLLLASLSALGFWFFKSKQTPDLTITHA